MLWKFCTQYASKFGKLSSGHRTGKDQFSFQSLRKAMPKNAQTTTLLLLLLLSRFSHVPLSVTPWTAAHQAPLSLGFFRQEYWSGLPFPSPIVLISHSSKVMGKILQASLQQYMNAELPDIQAGFRKGRKNRDQVANICWIIKKARELQKSIYFCFIDYAKAFDWVDHSTLWKILKEMGIPNYLTCLLTNLYAGQEATVRTGHWTTNWFQIGKEVRQSCILSLCLFNLYAEYIMWNAGLEEAQAGI